MLPYKEAWEINDRYSGSIIYYGGDPVMCDGAGAGAVIGGGGRFGGGDPDMPAIKGKVDPNEIVYRPLGPDFGRHQEHAPIRDEKFTDGPFKLGYTNAVEWIANDGTQLLTTSFVSRAPIRRWKQGLTQQNTKFGGHRLTFAKACQHKGFAAMLRNDYPKMPFIRKTLGKKNVVSLAFNRHWAIHFNKLEQYELAYRGETVGGGDDIELLKLAPKYQFLQEALDHASERAEG